MNGNAHVELLKDRSVIDVKDGNLRLTAYKTGEGTYAVPTSVVTQDKMNFKYGYVEIKAKLPLQKGVWSSFWIKSVADTTDTKSLIEVDNKVVAEVDVIEVFNTNNICTNIHKWNTAKLTEEQIANGVKSSWTKTSAYDSQQVPVEKVDTDWHIYGYEWTDKEIIMYYDGDVYARYDTTKIYSNDKTETDMSCFQDAQFLIFNNHLFYEGISSASPSVVENESFTSADF